ncbi:MAG: hypothetical protein WCP79_02615 [Bacillota bacterium]
MKKVALLFILIMLLAATSQAERLQVLGSALVYNNNTDQAFLDAKADALRKGIEQEIGVLVDSKSVVVNGLLLSDEIKTKALGYVSIISIDNKQRSGDVFYVTLTADFSADKIKATADDLASRLAQIRQERSKIIVAVTGMTTGGMSVFDINNYLAEKLRLQGFAVVSDDKIMQYIENNYKTLSDIKINNAVRKLAEQDFKAQTILRGSIKTVRVSKDLNNNWYTAVVRPSLQIIRTDSDDVDPFSQYITASAGSAADAEGLAWEQALNKSAQELGNRVVETVQDNQYDGDNMNDYLFRFQALSSAQRNAIVIVFEQNGCAILNETVTASGDYVFYVETAKKLSTVKSILTQNLALKELPGSDDLGAKTTVYAVGG